ncbi:RNA polymerase sigma factor ['Paenibacillus yunnanensis' Narsing Rao et al. 2020]|uniref:RNA polymerase sigma factor n=1 Tax=Paenibacillus tengchongensis TaxID=2608684 RepID=UPI00124C618C|nr:RNA polymerase sigma factor [Paenibacillus tengchongensis]
MESNRKLFETYSKEVYRTCYFMVHDARDAEDLCQEVFITAFRSPWREVEYLRAWLLKIAVNACLNHLKRSRSLARKVSEHAYMLAGKEMKAPERAAEEREQAERIAEAMNRLPAQIRAVLTLRYMHDFSLADIAEALSIPLGTAKSRQHKGLKLMKELLKDSGMLESEGGNGGYEQAGTYTEAAVK